jgi:hypothetical protein
MNLQFHNLIEILRQRQCDHDYCVPAFSQINALLTVVMG